MIRETRYLFTLGPHDYYWFLLRPEETGTEYLAEVPKLKVKGGLDWWDVLKGKNGELLFDKVLPLYLQRARWFRSKGHILSQVSLVDTCQLKKGEHTFLLLFIQVSFTDKIAGSLSSAARLAYP